VEEVEEVEKVEKVKEVRWISRKVRRKVQRGDAQPQQTCESLGRTFRQRNRLNAFTFSTSSTFPLLPLSR
jgi:hypothetical protein